MEANASFHTHANFLRGNRNSKIGKIVSVWVDVWKGIIRKSAVVWHIRTERRGGGEGGEGPILFLFISLFFF